MVSCANIALIVPMSYDSCHQSTLSLKSAIKTVVCFMFLLTVDFLLPVVILLSLEPNQ